MKNLILVIFMCISQIAVAQLSGRLTTPIESLEFTTRGNFNVVKCVNFSDFYEVIGAPLIPVKIKKFVLPLNAVIDSFTIVSFSKKEIPGSYTLYPSQPPVIPDGRIPLPFQPHDSAIYNSSSPYPGKIAKISNDGLLMGFRVITITFYPVEFVPLTHKLYVYDSIDFLVGYTIDSNSVHLPVSVSTRRKNLVTDFVKEVVENDNDVEQVSGGVNGVPTDVSLGDVTFREQFPFNMGISPDYVIITTNELKDSFRQFVEWKNKKGIPTVIATLNDNMIGKYPGCDTSEQIRNYLITLDTLYGPGLFVLLGGDINLIPSRVIRATQELTDYYYATTDNWNSNGNHIFCESEDLGVTYHPSRFVGRIPVKTVYDVNNYCRKATQYEKLVSNSGNNIDASFLKRMLVMAGSISESDQTWRDETNSVISNTNYIPASITKYKLYDFNGDEVLSRSTAISNLSKSDVQGYGLVFHFDHSGPKTMGTSATIKHQEIINEDIDGITNNTATYFVFSVGCKINKFNENAISKHFINNPSGGGLLLSEKPLQRVNPPIILVSSVNISTWTIFHFITMQDMRFSKLFFILAPMNILFRHITTSWVIPSCRCGVTGEAEPHRQVCPW